LVIIADYASFSTDYANFYTREEKCATIYSRNQKLRKEYLEMKTFGKAIAKVINASAKAACNSTSLIGCYQPVAPKQMKTVKSSEKK